eukprot:TRINITY_DN5050_c0_g1_i1.p1 TRINITY_DN5050_c0_g1~~TRINITY_DN5050_c0_g1_i1.p1  ORF type:complete len:125 (-),score=7.17 TRINITY_DN5050_c0_g1_i1:284-658(-)
MMEKSPSLFGRDQRRGENDGMERHVIFTHELIEFDIFTLPPFFVLFLEMIGGYGNVADGSIKPNVKYFIFELLDWNRNSPFQVSCYALRLQTHVNPSVGYADRVRCPDLTGFIYPGFELSNYFG